MPVTLLASRLGCTRHQVLYNASTEHIIMIPSSARKYLGLASKRWGLWHRRLRSETSSGRQPSLLA